MNNEKQPETADCPDVPKTYCPLELECVQSCVEIAADEWRCVDGCFRQAQKDFVIPKDAELGSDYLPAEADAATEYWSKCWSLSDLLNLLNDPKGLKSIDDSDPLTTTITLNDGTTFTSDEEQHDNPDTYIKTAVLNAAGTAYVLTRVDANGDTVSTITIPLPAAPTNCAGDEVTRFVGCAEMGEGLTWDPDEGKYNVDTQDLCIQPTEGTSECASVSQVYLATDPDTGCTNIVTADTLSLRVGSSTPDSPTVVIPLDPTNSANYYSVPELSDDRDAGTIDFDKLALLQVSCKELDFPCDGNYEFDIGLNPILDWDLQGESAVIGFIDDEPFTVAFPRFNSTSGTLNAEMIQTVTAGTHEVCLYLIGGNDPAANLAQMVFSANQPNLVVRRVITSA